MPINRTFQKLKKTMKDGFHDNYVTIYSGNDETEYNM